MIALDSSSLIAYLAGDKGEDTKSVDITLTQETAALPPVVLSEIHSDPKLSENVVKLLDAIPLLLPTEGYWERAGRLRSKLIARKIRAPLADALIAQSCIDYGVPLITRNQNFRHFAHLAGLRLV